MTKNIYFMGISEICLFIFNKNKSSSIWVIKKHSAFHSYLSYCERVWSGKSLNSVEIPTVTVMHSPVFVNTNRWDISTRLCRLFLTPRIERQKDFKQIRSEQAAIAKITRKWSLGASDRLFHSNRNTTLA